MQEITIDELKEALNRLPPEIRAELDDSQVDTVSVKMELIKFALDLHKHNQGVDWETNKIKPKKITFSEIINDAKNLFDFLVE
tara:strand:- start:678 stop:926 length:249 start_codon:yes stop_codon:yes gene_type:complete